MSKKSESSLKLLQSVHDLRFECDKQCKTVHEMRMELQNVNVSKTAADRMCAELKAAASRKETEIDALNKQIVSNCL